jgi:hypothetical protein
MNETLKLTGNVLLQRFDESGKELESREIKNLVVTTGRNIVASRLASNTLTVTAPGMAVGTGATAAALGNTALVTQSGSRIAATINYTDSTNIITYSSTFGPGVPSASVVALQEAGLFLNTTSGDMIARTTFPVLNKDPADTIVINWSLTIS